jgi:hypothetical protein
VGEVSKVGDGGVELKGTVARSWRLRLVEGCVNGRMRDGW